MILVLVTQRRHTDRRDNKLLVVELMRKFDKIINISFGSYFLKAPLGDLIHGVEYLDVTSHSEFNNIIDDYDNDGVVVINMIGSNHIGNYFNLSCNKARIFNLHPNNSIYSQYIDGKYYNIFHRIKDRLINPVSYYYGFKQRLFCRGLNNRSKTSNVTELRPIIFNSHISNDELIIPSQEYFIKYINLDDSFKLLNLDCHKTYCTYLDQNFVFHPDYNGRIFKKDIGSFYDSLIPVFKKLNENNITILFCPHPSMSFEQYQFVKKKLGGLKIEFLNNGTTIYAVKVSSYCIAHYSIASIYAMFNNVPLLLTKTKELKCLSECIYVDQISSLLGVDILDLEAGKVQEFDVKCFKDTRKDTHDFGLVAESNQYEYVTNIISGELC